MNEKKNIPVIVILQHQMFPEAQIEEVDFHSYKSRVQVCVDQPWLGLLLRFLDSLPCIVWASLH